MAECEYEPECRKPKPRPCEANCSCYQGPKPPKPYRDPCEPLRIVEKCVHKKKDDCPHMIQCHMCLPCCLPPCYVAPQCPTSNFTQFPPSNLRCSQKRSRCSNPTCPNNCGYNNNNEEEKVKNETQEEKVGSETKEEKVENETQEEKEEVKEEENKEEEDDHNTITTNIPNYQDCLNYNNSTNQLEFFQETNVNFSAAPKKAGKKGTNKKSIPATPKPSSIKQTTVTMDAAAKKEFLQGLNKKYEERKLSGNNCDQMTEKQQQVHNLNSGYQMQTQRNQLENQQALQKQLEKQLEQLESLCQKGKEIVQKQGVPGTQKRGMVGSPRLKVNNVPPASYVCRPAPLAAPICMPPTAPPAVACRPSSNVKVVETHPNGNYVKLVNQSCNKAEYLTGCYIVQMQNGCCSAVYKIPPCVYLGAQCALKIYCCAADPGANKNPTDLVFKELSKWSCGPDICTIFCSCSGESLSCIIGSCVPAICCEVTMPSVEC